MNWSGNFREGLAREIRENKTLVKITAYTVLHYFAFGNNAHAFCWTETESAKPVDSRTCRAPCMHAAHASRVRFPTRLPICGTVLKMHPLLFRHQGTFFFFKWGCWMLIKNIYNISITKYIFTLFIFLEEKKRGKSMEMLINFLLLFEWCIYS